MLRNAGDLLDWFDAKRVLNEVLSLNAQECVTVSSLLFSSVVPQ